MKYSLVTSTAVALALLGSGAIANAADVMTPTGKMAMMGIDASKLIGRSVLAPTNDTVGTIEAVLTDRTGTVRYVLVGAGGYLGAGERYVAVSWDALSFTLGSDKIVVNASKDQLAAFPAHRFGDPTRRGKVYVYDDDLPTNPYLAEATRPLVAAPQLATTVNAVDTQKLIGLDIKNSSNDTIGEINGVLIDRGGEVKFVVVGVGGFLGIGERQVALPWSALTVTDNGAKAMANFTKDQLKALPEYKYADARRRGTVYSYEDDLRTNAYLADPLRPATVANTVDTQKLVGRNIKNRGGETVGEIDGVLIDRDGGVRYVVVGVGGFLGMGEKQVALPWDILTVAANGETVTANLAKDTLEDLPDYKYASTTRRGTVYSYEDELKTNAYLANYDTRFAPLPGANSFTEGQARARIEAGGFTAVSGLRKDEHSIWRGTAMKDGRTVNVALDYKGNLVVQ